MCKYEVSVCCFFVVVIIKDFGYISLHPSLHTHRLNFDGKVTMASVKNFILCNNEQEQIMQFGRTGNNDFYLDVQWPLSLFQAFAIALSSFDSKLGCD